MEQMIRLHASCVAVGGSGVLILGESGEGKSDLSLRLIDRGAMLVADDQVELTRKDNMISACAPESLSGLIEARGAGIFQLHHLKEAPVIFAIQLTKREWIERLPYPEPFDCLGISIPKMRLDAFDVSAPIKIEMALSAIDNNSMTVGALKE